MFEAIGAALIVGLSLGLFGSGGAILTLPSLIFFLGFGEKQAIVASLFIVSAIAGFTALKHAVNGHLDKRLVALVAIPGMLVSALGAKAGTEAPPWLQISLFAGLMIVAAGKMLLTKERTCDELQTKEVKASALMMAGSAIGFLTGFVGVGGGFLLVPALMIFAGMRSVQAMISSSAVVALQSASGFLSYGVLQPELFAELPIVILASITVVGIVGATFGVLLQTKINQPLLNRFYAMFLIVVASAILVQRWLM